MAEINERLRISARPSAIICSATSRTGSWSSAGRCDGLSIALSPPPGRSQRAGMEGKAIVTLSRSSVEPF